MAVTDPLSSEESRVRAVYSGRKRSMDERKYSLFNRANLFRTQELERQMLDVLERQGCVALETKQILEIGCGTGYWLREFIRWGARPENLTGIDLLPERTSEARHLCPESVRIGCGNAAKLEFLDATFDVILQLTVFTSILDPHIRVQVASEMLRVVKPDGLILWYDFHVRNPWNPDVRAVTKRELITLFPGCKFEIRRITLAPPIARRLCVHSWLLCYLLGRFRFFCTHYLAAIRKG